MSFSRRGTQEKVRVDRLWNRSQPRTPSGATAGTSGVGGVPAVHTHAGSGQGGGSLTPTSLVISTPVTYYFEAILKSSSGGFVAKGQLYDETAAALVTGSTVSTTSTSAVRQRSAAITLVAGHEYSAQMAGAAGGGTITMYSAVIVASYDDLDIASYIPLGDEPSTGLTYTP